MTSTSSFFHPPSNYKLSDTIVGSVTRSSDPRGSRFKYIARQSDSSCNDPTQVYHFAAALPKEKMETETSTRPVFTADMFSTNESIEEVNELGDQKSRYDSPAAKIYKNQRGLVQRNEHDEQVDRIDNALLRRRNRCRVNQARYRERQRKMATDLTKSVERLKQDIYKLELQQQRLACVTSPSGSVWEAVAKYFKLFERGYTFFTMKELPEQNKPQSAQNHVQLEFLRSMMELDVTDGPLCGAEALLDNWRLLSLYHDDLHVQLKRLEQGPNNSLVATATIGLTITANTLLNVYPHLLTGVEAASDRGGWPPLASKLLNQRLEVLASVRFDWESDCGRVVRLESKADLLAPILRLVGSLENVARVFDGALVTPELRVTKVVQ